MPSERAEPSAAGEGPLDARQLLRDALEPEPVPEQSPGWTLRDAFGALERATDRDEVVRSLLRYSRDFVEAAAVFAVTPEGILGVDAVGWDDARSRCRAVHLSADESGFLGAVLSTRGPSLGPVPRRPANERLLAALGRDWPVMALAMPIPVRERVACVLYADNGEAPISARRVGDLLLAAGTMGAALERVLRRAKEDAARPLPDERGWGVREPEAIAVPAHAVSPAEDGPPEEFQVIGPGGR